jgi:hypothetical protein
MNTSTHRVLISAIVCVCGLAAGWAQGSEERAATAPSIETASRAREVADSSLPIKRITLYRSGVGSFERRGRVDGDSTVHLKFSTEQINDILKSMVVLDFGGEVASVGYGSKEPLARRLASFGVDISKNPSVQEILGQLRGSKATITMAEGQVSGTILGVEFRLEAQGNAHEPVNVAYLNLLTGSGIRSISYRTITNVVLDDKELNEELMRALAALAEHRADRTKVVDIGFRGDGARDVAVAYVSEMPVWKTSYRLVLPDAKVKEGLGKGGSSPMLQGWAIVENTTDEDWKDVTLSLVSGRPVSFEMDLYEPMYLDRPWVAVPTVPGVSPRIYGGSSVIANRLEEMASGNVPPPKQDSLASRGRRELADTAAGVPASSRAPGGLAKAEAEYAQQRFDASNMAAYGGAAQAQGVEAGEVFQYQVDHPVTVERQRSAMIPILSEQVDGRRVSIFNRTDGSQYPMRGVEVTNSSKLQLMPGPISVYDGGTYAGDAQIGHVPPGDKRLLAYAVDLDVNAVAQDTGSNTVQKVRIVKGIIEQTFKQVQTTSYAFKNKDNARERLVIVEHPRVQGWDLVKGDKAPKVSEQTEQFYRFELPIGAGKEGVIAVSTEQVGLHTAGVLDYDFNWLLEQHNGGKMSKEAIDAVREAGRRRGLVVDADRKIAALDQEKNEIDQDQNRLRQNMTSIDRASELYSRYMKKLSDQETRLDGLRDEIAKERENRQRLQAELEAFVNSLNVE